MKNLSTNQIRSLFIDFFEKKSHIHLPSSSLVPQNDSTALFANSGMFQFKDVFTGKATSSWPRVVTVQKCLRAGGKHNDLENVGKTARHHTFFEMLGNFSFGEYFKEDAIRFAWEFLTKELEIPKEKLIITVFHEDLESIEIWKRVANLEDSRIIKISTKDNFWEMGDSGPCGPCSEIFYDYGPSFKGSLPGEDDGERYIEIWNLVFMEFERIDGKLYSLPKKSIDTGMGLERIAAVCQEKHDNFQTDIFSELIEEFKRLSKLDFKFEMNDPGYIAARVVSDHIRSASFLISEDILPGNNGREYVLKRILRRAMVFLLKIGINEIGILSKLSKKLIEIMGSVYKELIQKSDQIQRVILSEEEGFQRTIKNGLAEFNSIINEKYSFCHSEACPVVFSGEDIFRLYDTFGFPVDLTEDLVFANGGLLFDRAGFENLMEKQKELAKKSWKGAQNYQKENTEFLLKIKERFGETEFVGYENYVCKAVLLGAIFSFKDPLRKFFIFNKTPIYSESGGQISDSGSINLDCEKLGEIIGVKKYQGIFIHECKIFDEKLNNFELSLLSPSRKYEIFCEDEDGDCKFYILNEDYNNHSNSFLEMEVFVDIQKRKKITKNHTAAHLLHSALKKVLCSEIEQKGSSVTDSRLRFDFNFSGPIPREKLLEIEEMINRVIFNDIRVSTQVMKRDEALKTGATALFDEKYGDFVRVIEVSCGEDDFCSMEFCGGTHVSKTSEILLFKIVSEEAVASGIRRIEALTGSEALKFLNGYYDDYSNLLKEINIKKDSFSAYVQNLIKKNKENEIKIFDFEKSDLTQKILKNSEINSINFEGNQIDLYCFSDNSQDFKLKKAAVFDFCSIKKNAILFFISNSESKETGKKSVNLIVSMNEGFFISLPRFSAKEILLKLHNYLEIKNNPSGGLYFASSGSNQNLEPSKAFEEFRKIFYKEDFF